MEYCINLTTLSLDSNLTDNISPLSGLTGLTWLSLHDNQIGDISPLSGLTGLTALGLGSNQIGDISPLSGLTSLTWLYLDGNQTDNISPLSGLTGLTRLALDNNRISDISPLSGLTGLTWLGLGSNQTDSISALSGLTSLTWLYLYNNQISDISPLTGLTGLTELLLTGNQISDLQPLSGLTSLTTLALVSNQIGDIEPLSNLTSLTLLRLDANQIVDISPLQDLTSLTTLGLDANQISDLSPLFNMTSLTALYVGGNQVSDLSPLSGLTSLSVLLIDYNQASDLSPLTGLTSLSSVSLDYNQIRDIQALVDNPGLGTGDGVDLQGNPLNAGAVNDGIPALEAREVTVTWDGNISQPPNQPSNVLPVDAATDVSLTPTLQSSAFSDNNTEDTHAASQWQITTMSGDYSSPVFDSDTDVLHLTSITTTPLDPSTTYYWRVAHQDNHGDWSEWSAETSFVTKAPPARPWRSSPPHGYQTEDTTPSFDWSDVYDPMGVTYWLQIASDYGFSSLVLDKDELLTSDYTLAEGEALADGKYYWRVCAVDGLGNQSAWTSGWLLTVDTSAPIRPWRSSPPHGYQTEDTTPSFDWSSVSDPAGVTYWLQIAYDYGFTSLALDKYGLATSDYTLAEGETLADGKYYWRVCAVDGLGHQSAWTSGWALTVDTSAPIRPWRSSPPRGYQTEDTTPSFDWSNVSDPTGVTYWLQIANDYNFTSLMLDKAALTVSEYTLDELEALADGKYYWRVCAVDGLGHQSTWTSGWAMTVDTTAPAKPWRSSPPHGYTTDDTTPSFDWSNVSDPTGVTYRLQIAYDYSFSSLALDKDSLTVSEYTLDELEALADGSHYWRVCAVDGLGHQSAWTSGWLLTVAT
ncbi:MAG: leucine-rich repeat domain-containing protein [Dehalococcoidia bacterium]|nr:leucine-rich repeat domain-containing protein [Dehalococcoidia bacterium]